MLMPCPCLLVNGPVQLIQPCSSEQISPQRIVPLQPGKMYKVEKEFLKSPARTTLVQPTARPDIPVLSQGLRCSFLPRGCRMGVHASPGSCESDRASFVQYHCNPLKGSICSIVTLKHICNDFFLLKWIHLVPKK